MGLEMPTLILPSLQVNMRAGNLPPIDASGRLFLKVPINAFGGTPLDRFASEERKTHDCDLPPARCVRRMDRATPCTGLNAHEG